ncbi:uncharacterized protein HaLaN_09636, partial [Haematococcus lacustris]
APLQPAPQPQRTAVQLCQWGAAPGPVQGTVPQPLLLLDAASGLVFQAPPKLLQARQAQEQAKLAPPLPQHWRPVGSAHYTFSGSQQQEQHMLSVTNQALQQRPPKFDGAALVPALEATPYTRPGRRTGALQAAGPMPYPRLVGRLQPPDNRLLPAPLPALHQLFSVLLGVAAEPYQLQTLFKVHDRSGNGLGLLELQELLHRMPGAGTPVVTSTGVSGWLAGDAVMRPVLGDPECDLLLAALDTDGDGRVTLDELLAGCQRVGAVDEDTGDPVLAAEARTLEVLHAAATKLGSYATLSDFWLQYAHLDKRRLGRISIDAATTLLVKSLPELPAPDVELVLAYLGAASIGRDSDISPDELLLLFHALPMHFTWSAGRSDGYEPEGAPTASHDQRIPGTVPGTAAQPVTSEVGARLLRLGLATSQPQLLDGDPPTTTFVTEARHEGGDEDSVAFVPGFLPPCMRSLSRPSPLQTPYTIYTGANITKQANSDGSVAASRHMQLGHGQGRHPQTWSQGTVSSTPVGPPPQPHYSLSAATHAQHVTRQQQ